MDKIFERYQKLDKQQQAQHDRFLSCLEELKDIQMVLTEIKSRKRKLLKGIDIRLKEKKQIDDLWEKINFTGGDIEND